MKTPAERAGRMQHRISPVEVRAASGTHRTLTFTASTDEVARDGDIIEQDGWQVANYLRNPVFLWSHNPTELPIGRGTNVRVNGNLEIDVEFDIDERSDDVYGKYERGFLNAVSVGYKPLAYRIPDDEERSALKMDPSGLIWTRCELFELSAVTVPADTGALIHNDAFDSMEDRLARDVFIANAVDETPETRAEDIDPDPVDLTVEVAAEPVGDDPERPPERHMIDLSAVDGAHLGAILNLRKALK